MMYSSWTVGEQKARGPYEPVWPLPAIVVHCTVELVDPSSEHA